MLSDEKHSQPASAHLEIIEMKQSVKSDDNCSNRRAMIYFYIEFHTREHRFSDLSGERMLRNVASNVFLSISIVEPLRFNYMFPSAK